MEPADWFFNHSESSKRKPRYKNTFCYVACTMRVGHNVATIDLQLYLRQKTAHRLNRKHPKGQRPPFRSKYRIARRMLAALRPLLPKGWRVYVQFDRHRKRPTLARLRHPGQYGVGMPYYHHSLDRL